jgi:hypothetical protein
MHDELLLDWSREVVWVAIRFLRNHFGWCSW